MSLTATAPDPADVETTIHSSDIPVVLEFGAPHCPPCRRLEPLLAQLADRYRGRVAVVTVNASTQPDLANRYQVRSVPTLLAFRRGRVVAQQVGFSSPRRVEELFAGLAAAPAPPAPPPAE